MRCPNCPAKVQEVWVGGHKMLVDAEPDLHYGQVLVVGDRGVYLDGPVGFEAKQKGIPLYRRHMTHCPNPWGRDDLKPLEISPDAIPLIAMLLAEGMGPDLVREQ